jgi:hypothetical protein
VATAVVAGGSGNVGGSGIGSVNVGGRGSTSGNVGSGGSGGGNVGGSGSGSSSGKHRPWWQWRRQQWQWNQWRRKQQWQRKVAVAAAAAAVEWLVIGQCCQCWQRMIKINKRKHIFCIKFSPFINY